MGDIDEVLKRVGDGNIKELLTEFRGEIEREHAKELQKEGWRAPTKIDEDRLTALNARSEELRKQRPTAEVMQERKKVGEEIREIINSSGAKFTVDRQ